MSRFHRSTFYSLLSFLGSSSFHSQEPNFHTHCFLLHVEATNPGKGWSSGLARADQGSSLGPRLDLGPVKGAGVAAGHVRGFGVAAGHVRGVRVASGPIIGIDTD